MAVSPEGSVVVGGGIAGLAAALRLVERAGPTSVRLVEGGPRLGGKIATERVDGFVVEGGPDSFLSMKPAGVALCRSLGIEERLHGTDSRFRRVYVKRAGRLHELPGGMAGIVPTRARPLWTTRLLSPLGRLRAGLELFVPAARDGSEESVAGFVTRRFGAQAYERLFEPLLGGLFAGDARALSLDATFPQLREIERAHGSVLRMMWRNRRRSSNGSARSPRPGFLTLPGGMAEIVTALERRLPEKTLCLGVPATRVDRSGEGYSVALADGSVLRTSGVVLATPAFVTADLLRDLDAELAAGLREIPFVSTATASVGYPPSAIARPLDGTGYLSPRAEGGPVIGCTWSSNKFAGRAPEGGVLLRFFLGRAGEEEVATGDDDRIRSVVRKELRTVLGIESEPSFWRIFRWPRGLPQYTLGHRERLARIERRLGGHPRLALAGCSYRGVGIPDCIESGRAAADRVLA